MSFKCKIGFHTWNGCKCTKCGKTRDEQHDWSQDCEKCSKCGMTRENQHDWSKDCEVCSKCGKTREKPHEWSKDCEKCSKCGKARENKHDWKGCICSICGKTRDEQHDWSMNCEKCSTCGKARKNAHIWKGFVCSVCGTINKPTELQKYNVFGQYKYSSNTGWVLYFGSEAKRDELHFNLSKLGIDSERRHGRTGFMYFHWLIVGTPVYLVDDLVGALEKYECYFNQNESEWHPYNILIRDSEPV